MDDLFLELFKYIEGGDIDEVKRLIETRGIDNISETPSISDQTVLHVSIITNQKKIFDYLLGRGVDIDATNDHGETPLILAVSLDRVEFVKELLDCGANTKPRSSDGLNIIEVMLENNSEFSYNKMSRMIMSLARFD